MRPFVYKELTEYAKELGRRVSSTDYLVWGGFPKRLELDTAEARDLYLEELNKSIIENDLIIRYKIKNADVALNSLRVSDGRYDLTHNFENIIYNELIYRGFQLEVYNGEKEEIDFVAKNGSEKYYIQVAYSVADEKAYDREMKAFLAVPNDAEKILITNDEIDYSTSVVRHVKFKDFLQKGLKI